MITQLIKNGEVVDTSAESNSSSSTSKKSGGSLDKDAFLQLVSSTDEISGSIGTNR